MEQKKINYILAKASDGANKYPIEDILARFGVSTQVRGTQAWFVCPVCGKPKYDYCSATIKGQGAGLWCCQSCKTGGGTFRLYALLSGCSDTEALLSLGVLSGTISNEEYEKATGTEDSRAKLKADEDIRRKIAEKKATETVERKAPIQVVDYIYRKMLSLPEFKLTEEGREYLRDKRHYSDKIIEDMGFFSYTSNFSVNNLLDLVSKEKFGKGLRELEPQDAQELYNSLWGIPGFYFKFDNASKKTGAWRFAAPNPDCIGIPIYNGEGYITALQMRWINEEKCKGAKYFYISSRKYHQREWTNYGSSPGSPVAALYPESITGKTLYVTEGVFKAKELSEFGNICFSVQGVNSFYYVADEISLTLNSSIYKKRGGQGAERVILVFDADSFTKWQVLDAVVKASSNIARKSGLPTYILFWNPKLGKGFDDMKFYCLEKGIDYKKEMRVVDWRTFADFAKEAEEDTDRYWNTLYGKEPDAKERTGKEWGNYLYFYLFEMKLKRMI